MSVETTIATQSAPPSAGGALAASSRVQRLQALAAELESGPASFAAALDAASAGQGAARPSTATGAGNALGSTALAGSTLAQTAQAGYSALPSAGAGYAAMPSTMTTSNASLPYGTTTSGTQQLPSDGQTGGSGQYDQLIAAAAARNGIDPAVLHGLIQQESGFDPSSRSSAGAVGLTQLMPSTAASLGVSEPLDPAQSIEGGARYLGEMLHKFGGNVSDALAAYNAGPGAVQRYGGVPPYAETQQYVTKVLGYAAEYQRSGTAGQAAIGA